LPRNGLVVIDDRQVMEDTIGEIEEQAVAARQEGQREGTLPEDFPTPYLSLSEMQDALESKHMLEMGYPAAGVDGWPEVEPDKAGELDHHLADCFSAQPRFGGRLKQFMDFMGERYLSGERLLVVSRQAARLQELWNELRLTNDALPPVFVEGSLSEGWRLDANDGQTLHLLTDGEIFGWRRPETRRRARPAAEAPEAGYSDLNSGDYVVHVDHGIGRFQGLVQRTIEGVDLE